MYYYYIRNKSGNTLSGRGIFDDPLKLTPAGTDGDRGWFLADDVIRLAGLTDEGAIDSTNIEILDSFSIQDPSLVQEQPINYDYEIVAVTTTDANYKAVTFSQPVLFADICVRGRANVGRFRKASDSGDYIEIGIGEVKRIYCGGRGKTIGYVARNESTNITFECIGYFGS